MYMLFIFYKAAKAHKYRVFTKKAKKIQDLFKILLLK